MTEEKDRKHLSWVALLLMYGIASLVGALTVLFYCLGYGVFSAEASYALRYTSNGFFLAGGMLFGFGMLVLVANGGAFTFLHYAFERLFSHFMHSLPAGTQNYGDWVAARGKKHTPYGFLLIVGGVFLLVAFVLTMIWESKYDPDFMASSQIKVFH